MSNAIRNEIIEAIARNLFVQAYADFMEDSDVPAKAKRGFSRPGGGEDWCDFAPSTSKAARETAKLAAESIERLNDRTLDDLYEQAHEACRVAKHHVASGTYKCTPEGFGSDLGMMLTGTGVSWFDDHAHFPIKVPDVMFSIVSRGEIRNGTVGSVSERFAHKYE